VSREQAGGAGLSRTQIGWLLARGSLIRALPSVYRAAAAPETWRQTLMAASLWARGKAVISRQSAAALWEFESYWRTRVELSGLSNLSPPPGVVYHQVSRLAAADVTTRRGIRVTSVARTIVDLAAVVSPRTLERTLDEALRKQMVTLKGLRYCIDRNGRRGRGGIAHLELLMAERYQQHAPDSPLETDVAALVRESGLPSGVKRYLVIEGDFVIAEVDLAWPREKVAVQAHGSRFHRQPRNWENDQQIENQLQLHGWVVVKVTARMVAEAPGEVVDLIARALGRRPQRIKSWSA
jgi:very-short-patch-repair endonuclease